MSALLRTSLLFTLLLAPLAARAQGTEEGLPPSSAEEEAGDVSEVDKDRQGPLRERVRPVSGHLFTKRGRVELSPSATVSLRDAFFTKYIFGGSLTFHLSDHVALGVRAGYSQPTVAGVAQICTLQGGTRGCRPPTFDELDGQAPGQITLLGGADLQWSPLYGKASLLAESFLHFDLYAIGGLSAVQYRGPPVGSDPSPTTNLTFGPNLGVGGRIFLTRWLTLRAELRDVIYTERFTLPATTLRNQLLFELGLSVFLPSFYPES